MGYFNKYSPNITIILTLIYFYLYIMIEKELFLLRLDIDGTVHRGKLVVE